MATTDRAPRCRDHNHHHAGCHACRRYSAWYKRDREQRIANGWVGMVDDLPQVRRHVRGLCRRGATLCGIARKSGVAHRHLQDLINGHHRLIHADTRDAILGVSLTTAGGGRYVDATGTRRRLQALIAIGHTTIDLGAELGCSSQRVSNLCRTRQVTPWMAGRVRELYDRLSMTPGQSEAGASRARNRGWAVPLAWDDDTIDDPAARPHTDAAARPRTEVIPANVTGAITGDIPADELTTAEKVEAVRYLLWLGWNHERIGTHLRWAPTPDGARQAVTKFCERHNVTSLRTREAIAA